MTDPLSPPRQAWVLRGTDGFLEWAEPVLLARGYVVTIVESSKELFERLRSARPDAIVLDVMHPYKDAFPVLHRLKAEPPTAEIPVLMLTRKMEDATVFRGWRSGLFMD
jgi:DNA-binding response OmpR family regulator